MHLSPKVKNACIIMLSEINEMTQELLDLHQSVMTEMSKGRDRDLRSLLDELVRLSVRGHSIAETFKKNTLESSEGEDPVKVLAEINSLLQLLSGDNTEFLKDMDPILAAAVIANKNLKTGLENEMDSKFGKGALMIMITEDGLLPEFLEKMHLSIYPKGTPDRESINEFAKAIAENSIHEVSKTLH